MNRLLFVLAASLITACGPSATPAVAFTLDGLTLEAPGSTFPIESSIQLKAWAHYSDGTRVDVTTRTAWTSSFPDIGTIGPSGIVHFAGAGSTKFEGAFEGKVVAVTMFSTAAVLQSLEVSSRDIGDLPRGDTRRFTATAHYSDGSLLDVTDRADWSADGSVVAMSGAGVVVGREPGEGTVRARFAAHEVTARLEVVAPRFTMLAVGFPTVVIRPGDLHPLQARATYSDGSARDVTAETSWSTSNAAVLAVRGEPGVIVAMGEGRARITASWQGSTASVQLQVLVAQPVLLSFELASVQVASGLSERVGLYADLDNGTRVFVGDVAQYTSSQPAVVEVLEDGAVIGHALGAATIRAEYAGLVATYEVEVTSPVLTRIDATLPGGRLLVGQSANLKVFGTWSDGSRQNLSSEVSLTHGPELVTGLAADRLLVTAAELGPVNLTVEFGGQVQQLSFEVTSAQITGVVVQPAPLGGIGSGPSVSQQRFRAFATYSDGVVAEVTELCSWWIDDATFALLSDEPGERGTYRLADGGTTAVRAMFNGQMSTLVWDFPRNP
jgi:hypothetical protein